MTTARSRKVGVSTAFSCGTSCASETARPSRASANACFRLAGVIRLAAPSSSSSPQRPQFESSFIARRKSASVAIVGRAFCPHTWWLATRANQDHSDDATQQTDTDSHGSLLSGQFYCRWVPGWIDLGQIGDSLVGLTSHPTIGSWLLPGAPPCEVTMTWPPAATLSFCLQISVVTHDVQRAAAVQPREIEFYGNGLSPCLAAQSVGACPRQEDSRPIKLAEPVPPAASVTVPLTTYEMIWLGGPSMAVER